MEKCEKRPISPVLKKMEVNQTEVFPRVQYGSLNTIIHKVRIETDMIFSKKIQKDGIVVTREA